VALGLLGLPWADGDGMGRLSPQPSDNLDPAAASILEPEVPAGGIGLMAAQRYASIVRYDERVALEVRCGGNGGRCGRILGLGKVIVGTNPTKSGLHLTNEGWATSNGYPLLEDVVRPDFSGSTGIFDCPTHTFLITEHTGERLPVKTLPTGRWARGVSVQLPFELLRQPYQDFLRYGKFQVVRWVPTSKTAVLVPDWPKRQG
jgi:hypothetical protein